MSSTDGDAQHDRGSRDHGTDLCASRRAGKRPALIVIDRSGVVQFDSVGTQQWQIPTNKQVLKVLARLTG